MEDAWRECTALLRDPLGFGGSVRTSTPSACELPVRLYIVEGRAAQNVLFLLFFLETVTMERHRTHISSAVEEARDEESPDKVWM